MPSEEIRKRIALPQDAPEPAIINRKGDNGRNRAHSRDGPTPTGRSSGCTVDIAAKRLIPAGF